MTGKIKMTLKDAYEIVLAFGTYGDHSISRDSLRIAYRVIKRETNRNEANSLEVKSEISAKMSGQAGTPKEL